MGQILLVRHGQAAFGTEDYDRLTELGRAQARLLGDWFARRGQRLERVVTGDMKRHRQTAEVCLAALPESLRPGDAWRSDAGFDEYDADEVVIRHRPEFADPVALKRHLDASGNPRRAFQGIFSQAMQRWMGGSHDAEYRETWSAFCARCVGSLRRIAEDAQPSNTTVVFTSGGPIAAICQHLLGLSHERAFEVNTSLVNSAITGLLHRPGLISLSFLNSFAHLEQTGDPNVVTYR